MSNFDWSGIEAEVGNTATREQADRIIALCNQIDTLVGDLSRELAVLRLMTDTDESQGDTPTEG